MSASDHTSIKKFHSMNNKFSSKSSGNETAKKKINVIRNINNSDVFGIAIEKTWFNIPITNTCVNATIQSSIITTPIISKIPDMTIPMAIKFRNKPNILSLNFVGITSSIIVLEFAGVFYTNVSISRDGTKIGTDITGNTYTDTGLTANTSYTYVITPYNSCDCNTGITLSATHKTLPDLTSFNVSSYTASQIVLVYTGNYTNVSITRNGTTIATGITTSTYTDSYILIGNTSYTYIITPHNSVGSGIPFTMTQKTLPNLTSLTSNVSASQIIVLLYTGNYTTVSITRDGTPIAIFISGTVTADTSILTANTSYTYVVTPYDTSGNAGLSLTITQKTLPDLTSLSISSYTASQIVLAYTGGFTTVSISRNGTTIATDISGASYTDASGLTANTSYTYIITPNNSVGSGIISTITQITLPDLTSSSVSSFTASQIELVYTGNYTTVSISRNGTTIATDISGTTYTDTGLTANTSYTYIVTPNNSGGSGITSTITQITLPDLTSLSVSSFTASQIVLAYTGGFTTVSIVRDASSIATGVSGTSYTDYGLNVNTSYTYIVTPYDLSGNSGTSMTISQITLPDLTSLSVSSFTASQIVLAYTGNYTNVSISRNGTTIATDISGTTYTDVGLPANTNYTYIVTPHNSVSSGITSTITQITLPDLTTLSVSSFTASQIVLAYTGNYTNVTISRNGTTIATDISGTSYTDNIGLTANTIYTYIITPNNTGGSGITSTITQITLPDLTTLSVSSFTDSQIVLAYTGGFTTVSISRNGTDIATDISGTTYTDIGLTANTSYIYVITPHNTSNIAGSTSTITQITLPDLTTLSVSSFTASQIVLVYSGGFTTVSISRNGTTIATDISGTSYTDIGLTANTSYTYIVTPYNSGGSGVTSTITQITLPDLTTLSVSSFTASQIVLVYTGDFTTVSISRNGTTIATDISGTTYTDIGLTANTSYIYVITPHNSVGSGITSTITQITLPDLTSLSVSSFTASQIVLAYTGNYTNVSITRDGITIATDISGTTYTNIGLTANTSYTYIITPYNTSNIAGSTSSITQITLPDLATLSISSFTASQIVLAYSGGFTTVSISRNGTDIATEISGTSYTDIGLTANTSYTYIIIPHNSIGSGITSTITQITLPDLTTLSVSSFTDTEIVLVYAGNYTNVSISRNGTDIATEISGNTYTDIGLTTNTSYTYIITPYNTSNIAGSTSSITQITV